MARGSQSDDEYVRERPAWIIPALILIGVLTFSGAFLYYYFGPTPSEILGLDPRASSADRKIDTIIADRRFLIPENYTRYPSQRGGGRRTNVDMHALLPRLTPYEADLQERFIDNSADSDVIYFTLAETATPLSSARRLKEIYSKYLAAPEPEQDRAGLQRFTFRDDSGYANQDLLVGTDDEGRMVLLLCDRPSRLVDSPNCARSLLWGPRLELSYRYKRSHLGDWREIDGTVMKLVGEFETREQIDGLQGPIFD
ncbi:MAG: hypothetical protein Q7V31_11785 [Parvibaculum sp.]|uniref:hypothetical protein n=1 Tax=Parvibaculum sp. TaxID=2024848 RepID=UPI00271A74D2|nr:hypothetical protein [Parvibaculum sp.]MDO8839599.1 hypothetical protein [Parvibaculum sp.]